jgi:hypothetical protein
MIAELIDCDVHRIAAADPYPASYDATVARNVREQNTDARPAIADPLASIEQYDTVLLGSPIWNVRPPMIMTTFTENHDFTGKTVHPFVTYAVSGLGSTERDYTASCPGARIAPAWRCRAKRWSSTAPTSRPGFATPDYFPAVQSEYSIWARDPEAEVLPVCEELGIGFVPWSPLGQGFLTGTVAKDQSFAANDIRSRFPRFTPEALAANQPVVDLVKEIAARTGVTPGQVALAWLLAKAPNIVPIPGTRKIDRLRENVAAVEVSLSDADNHRHRRPLRTPRGRRRPRQRT